MLVEVLVALLASVALTIWLLGLLWESRRSVKEIPGWSNPPSDPEVGDLALALSSGSLQDWLLLKHKGGSCPVVAFWWKKERVVSVCSLQAFKDTEKLYNRPRLIFAPTFEPLHGSKSIQSINDSAWKEKKKQLHGTIRGHNLESFFEEFLAVADMRKSLWTPGQPLQLKSEMFKMTLTAILNTSLGRVKGESDLTELIAAYDSCKQDADKWILGASDQHSQKFQKTLSHLQGLLRELLHSRMKAPKNDKALPLLDALIKSGDGEEDVIFNMTTFLGGFHTSGYYGMWIFLCLAKHPHIQEKLFQEIKAKVDGDTSQKLKAYTQTSHSYLRQVLDEIFRVSSTAAFTGHFSNSDILVDGYHIPAKTPIIQAIGVSMQNSALWENPGSFDPDRFALGSPRSKRGPEFRPFGISSIRRCPANHFIYLLMSVCVTVLVQHFVFSIAAGEGKEVKKKYGTATSPSLEGIQIQVELRKPTSA